MQSLIDLAIAITVQDRMPANKDEACTFIWEEGHVCVERAPRRIRTSASET